MSCRHPTSAALSDLAARQERCRCHPGNVWLGAVEGDLTPVTTSRRMTADGNRRWITMPDQSYALESNALTAAEECTAGLTITIPGFEGQRAGQGAVEIRQPGPKYSRRVAAHHRPVTGHLRSLTPPNGLPVCAVVGRNTRCHEIHPVATTAALGAPGSVSRGCRRVRKLADQAHGPTPVWGRMPGILVAFSQTAWCRTAPGNR